MSRYIVSDPAKQDIKEIKNYIARNKLAAARRFIEKFRQQCQMLAKFPQMGRSYENFAPSLRGFPFDSYIIFYRQIENGIEVERVLSGYRDLEALFLGQEDGLDDDESG